MELREFSLNIGVTHFGRQLITKELVTWLNVQGVPQIQGASGKTSGHDIENRGHFLKENQKVPENGKLTIKTFPEGFMAVSR